MIRLIRKIKHKIMVSWFFLLNRLIKKDKRSIMFVPHVNSYVDNYDLLNADSDNVLCFLNNLLRDCRYNEYTFYIGYYAVDKLDQYMDYCKNFHPSRLRFFLASDLNSCNRALCNCSIVFTDETFRRYRIKTKRQKIICLNYYAGFMKNDYYRIKKYGGFKRMLKEQKDMHDNYDKIVSTSDISSMFLNVEDCMYYGDIIPLGFSRNDIFYQDNSKLRKNLEKIIGIQFKYILTFVPTHRDYENEDRKEFYDEKNASKRSIFGSVTEEQLKMLEQTLEENDAIIIAKTHPCQARNVLREWHSNRIISYHDLIKNITTSLNPILAVTDFLITDYTTAVYDFMHLNRPIIYYFYDIDKYVGSRGLFIDPIDPICAGDIVYTIDELCHSIGKVCAGEDNYKGKREVISDLIIKYKDGRSSERLKDAFLPIETGI